MSNARATGGFEKNGKTRFNRGKPKGESWIARRKKAIDAGLWELPKQKQA